MRCQELSCTAHTAGIPVPGKRRCWSPQNFAGSPRCINKCTLITWGERGSTADSCSVYEPPFPGNEMLQTVSGLGIWSFVSPVLPFQVALPAVPSCVRAIPGWKKPILVLLNNSP